MAEIQWKKKQHHSNEHVTDERAYEATDKCCCADDASSSVCERDGDSARGTHPWAMATIGATVRQLTITSAQYKLL